MALQELILTIVIVVGSPLFAQTTKVPVYVDGATGYFRPIAIPASISTSKNVCELQSLKPVLRLHGPVSFECVKKTEMPMELQEQMNAQYKNSVKNLLPEKRNNFSKQFLKDNVSKWARSISCAAGLKKEIFNSTYNSSGDVNYELPPSVTCKLEKKIKSLCPVGYRINLNKECEKLTCPAGTAIGDNGKGTGDCGDLEANDCCLKCASGKFVHKIDSGMEVSLCEIKNYKK